eukprot:6214290-Pleurochrysis_carterae.AAC.2
MRLRHRLRRFSFCAINGLFSHRARRPSAQLGACFDASPRACYAYAAAPRGLCARGNLRARHASLEARRTSARRSRRLRNGPRSVGSLVDSGCTWHIYPHIADIVNVRACEDRATGIDGRPQRCVAVGDMPLTAINDAGSEVAVTLRNVR